MTYGARIFLIMLAFQLLIASPVPLEYPIIPQIDCNDLNGNGHTDFIAVNNSSSPRTLYHLEFIDSKVKSLWEYSMPENIKGYFSHMILGDFDNDGKLELIVAAYQNGENKIFYVFTVDVTGFNTDPPKIMGIGSSSVSITHPWKLYPMNIDLDGLQPFIVTQGSPSRHIIICKYINGKINRVGSYGNKFISESMGPLELSLGNFDGDGEEDIFILSNGPNPEGYFVFSNGLETVFALDNYPRLRILYNRGIDINIDGIDDLLMVDRTHGLRSNIWGIESITLSERKIQDIAVNQDNGLIHLSSISNKGKLDHYTIDPLTRTILTSEYNFPEFLDKEFVQVHSLITSNHIFLITDGKKPELWSFPIELGQITETPTTPLQRIYSRKSDYVINLGDMFLHPIETDTTKSFLHFTGKYLPLGMEFNLDNIQLEWVPTISQLGFHEFSYNLDLRENKGLKMAIENDMKLVTQKEKILEEKHAYLIYVNDRVAFNNKKDHITFVNTKLSEWIIYINDKNVDASLYVKIIKGDETSEFQLMPPETKDEWLDSVIIKSEKPIQNINEDTQFQDIVNSQINIHRSKFFWTPNSDQDNFQFSLEVSDGYSADTLSFNVTIHPAIDLSTNQTEFSATVNQTINIPLKIKQSPPSEHYTYELVNAPENMWVTDNGEINWIPMATDVDDNIFIINVSDGIAISKLQYNIFVNSIPVISSHPSNPFIITLGDSLSFPLKNFDMNENAKLMWKLLSGPTDMFISPEGLLKWTGNQLDNHPYEMQLNDEIDSVAWTGSIYVNVPPIITSQPITLITENKLYEYLLVAHDDNKINPLNSYSKAIIEFELLYGPVGMKIDDDILRWEPPPNTSGNFSVSVIATDGIDTTSQNFEILVNSFPVLTSMDSISVLIGDTLSYYIQAIDSNLNDSLSYFIDDLRPGMHLDNDSGLLTWLPSQYDIGQHYFNLQVKDGHGTFGVDYQLQIFVYVLPIFKGDLPIEAFVGLEYTAFLTAEDMFGEKIKNSGSIVIKASTIQDYTLSEIQDYTLSEPYGHYFKWIPKKIDTGNHEIYIRMTDKYGFSKLYIHNISVYKNPCFQCDSSPEYSPVDSTQN